MKKYLVIICAIVLVFEVGGSAQALTILDFEGIGDLVPVGDYYNGGAGPNYGVSFSANALALVDEDAGGSGNFGGEPSPDTCMYYQQDPVYMDVEMGFSGALSFWYSLPFEQAMVSIYSGLGATGTLLGQALLPNTPEYGAPDPNGRYSPLVPYLIPFAGIARSVRFEGAAHRTGCDDIGLNIVPEPSTMLLLGAGLIGLLALGRKKHLKK